ncbi:hypothetical protein Tco_1229651 [Tanacetum coccineum]
MIHDDSEKVKKENFVQRQFITEKSESEIRSVYIRGMKNPAFVKVVVAVSISLDRYLPALSRVRFRPFGDNMESRSAKVTALQGQQGPAGGPAQPELPEEAGSSS